MSEYQIDQLRAPIAVCKHYNPALKLYLPAWRCTFGIRQKRHEAAMVRIFGEGGLAEALNMSESALAHEFTLLLAARENYLHYTGWLKPSSSCVTEI